MQGRGLNHPEKQAIARKAPEMIEAVDTAAFSVGATTRNGRDQAAGGAAGPHARHQLDQHRARLAWERVEPDHALRRQLPDPSDTLVGPYAGTTLENPSDADVLFLGVHGIHPKAGLTKPNIAEASTNRRPVEADQRVIVADTRV
ncbi:MAG: hypothetical protein AVDCRST_MAG02-1152 [uncultured Rubrobacteraceae bacterium]|uniref:Uncharacterized protein n=1 Tax=uncultured Rubrobacteraceae bacterium TaxID=349277 RepID=A0A6J4QRQ6_9ACTN|nr:MAG: hypothetical protein AVDCRST_MAG02-1152 [uncultured Rubrobacteraceae bacterium]